MQTGFFQLMFRWLGLTLGVALATRLIPGIHCDDAFTLFCVAAVLGILNSLLKPIMVFFALPFIVLSLGLGMVVINALLFMLAGRLVEGFHVNGFLSAVGGAVVLSVTNLILSRFNAKTPPPSKPTKPKPDGDVIDI
jgi:putative membrane protein